MADLPTNRQPNAIIESNDINAIAQAVNGKIDATSAADLYYEKWFLDSTFSHTASKFHAHNAVDITSGILPPARLATGTPGAGKYPDPVNGWTTIPTGGGGGGGGQKMLGGLMPSINIAEWNTLTFAGASKRDETKPVVPNGTCVDIMPLTLGHTLTIDKISVKVTKGTVEGKLARFAIYLGDADGGNPGTLLWDSGNVVASVVGVHVYEQVLTLPQGVIWVAAAVDDESVAYAGFSYSDINGPQWGGGTPAFYQPRGYSSRLETPSSVMVNGYPADVSMIGPIRDHGGSAGGPVIMVRPTAVN